MGGGGGGGGAHLGGGGGGDAHLGDVGSETVVDVLEVVGTCVEIGLGCVGVVVGMDNDGWANVSIALQLWQLLRTTPAIANTNMVTKTIIQYHIIDIPL